jgi:hypothetical protein
MSHKEIVEKIYENLFIEAGIRKDEFRKRAQTGYQESFEAFIEPFSLTPEERKIRTGLSRIISTPFDSSISITRLPIGYLF